MSQVDAVVIGAGPNGLVASIALADAGWDVVVVEANPHVGGAVHSAEVTAPGFVTDMFSAFYPLAAASPVIRDLDLGAHGLEWTGAPDVLAHVLEDGGVAVLRGSAEDTAKGLDEEFDGDGDAWLAMCEGWSRIRDPLLDALFTPLPPVRSAGALLRRLGAAGTLDFARMALTPVRRLAEEHFGGRGAALLLTGNAMHSDVPPDAAGSGLFGWLLAMLGQDVGFPVPRGGAGQLAEALRSRAESVGVEFILGSRVVEVGVSGGRASGVRLEQGGSVRARRAVLADVPAPSLYHDLVGETHLPARLRGDLSRFQWDNATIKVNWALAEPIPWSAPGAAGAGTVHFGVDVDGFVDFAADLSVGRVPERPFALLGQMTTADPTRSPAGTESVWAYTHVPRGIDWGAGLLERHVERLQTSLERVAPGFADVVLARHVQSPDDLERGDPSLVGGAINAGTAALHQQLVFRPTAGLGRPETFLPGLYLASASAHPGGGVHGACGWNAARAALGSQGWSGPLRRRLATTAWSRLLTDR